MIRIDKDTIYNDGDNPVLLHIYLFHEFGDEQSLKLTQVVDELPLNMKNNIRIFRYKEDTQRKKQKSSSFDPELDIVRKNIKIFYDISNFEFALDVCVLLCCNKCFNFFKMKCVHVLNDRIVLEARYNNDNDNGLSILVKARNEFNNKNNVVTNFFENLNMSSTYTFNISFFTGCVFKDNLLDIASKLEFISMIEQRSSQFNVSDNTLKLYQKFETVTEVSKRYFDVCCEKIVALLKRYFIKYKLSYVGTSINGYNDTYYCMYIDLIGKESITNLSLQTKRLTDNITHNEDMSVALKNTKHESNIYLDEGKSNDALSRFHINTLELDEILSEHEWTRIV